ncbi:hypothetical protein Cgig2_000926 [Carnegiea gigantea]|uniref:DUF4283 domain-containing protein n=1 Tax=Carnegiea gigantea TaxID=171969 RepID=A0A9Q1QLH2_9CARY|nr:hypothetical protein Cgig2_000926 [Carnegiea gigantea]
MIDFEPDSSADVEAQVSLCLLDANEQPSKIEFSTDRFWVKIYDIPMSMRSLKFVELLSSKISSFMEVYQNDLLMPSKALKEKNHLLGLRDSSNKGGVKSQLAFEKSPLAYMNIDKVPIIVNIEMIEQKKDTREDGCSNNPKIRVVEKLVSKNSITNKEAEVALYK